MHPGARGGGGAGGGAPMPGGGGFISPYANTSPNLELTTKAMQLRVQAGANLKSGKGKEQIEANKWLNDAAAYEQNLDLMRSRAEVLADLKGKHGPTVAGPTSTDGPSATYHLNTKL